MPILIYGGLALAGLVATGWAAGEVGDAAEKTQRLTRLVVVGGAAYATYRAVQRLRG